MPRLFNGGDERIRTAEYSFCRAVPYHLATSPGRGAGDGDRTRDFLLGKEMLYH